MSTAGSAASKRLATVVEAPAAAATVVSWIRQTTENIGGLIAGYMMRRAARRLDRLAARQMHALPDRLLNDIGIARNEIDRAVKIGRQDAD